MEALVLPVEQAAAELINDSLCRHSGSHADVHVTHGGQRWPTCMHFDGKGSLTAVALAHQWCCPAT